MQCEISAPCIWLSEFLTFVYRLILFSLQLVKRTSVDMGCFNKIKSLAEILFIHKFGKPPLSTNQPLVLSLGCRVLFIETCFQKYDFRLDVSLMFLYVLINL